ncbi:MAG: rhodanese-like domain-containing protein [Desulfovibrionales bacterium]|nr:rhodanese-like domain-containing protein [Desulfovibrionales bacterium]
MKKVSLVLWLVVALAVGMGSISASAAGTIQVKSVDEAKVILTTSPNPVALLDVRTPDEYAKGHIGGALLFNYKGDDFERKLALLPKHIQYVIYSETNSRSSRAARILKSMGLSVIHMDGGFQEWKRKGYPVVK